MTDPVRPVAPREDELTLSLHRCKVCGTAWLLWPDAIHGGGWNLLDKYQRPGACCDNEAMGDQIEHLRDIPLAAAPVPCAASPADTTHDAAELRFRLRICERNLEEVQRGMLEAIRSWTPATPDSYAQADDLQRLQYQAWVAVKQKVEAYARATGEGARDGHEQCESDKNWLRAQRDVAEQKLKEALAVSRADLSVGGHDGRGSETSAEGRSESHDARLGRDAEVSSVRQTDGAVDCARDIPADSHLPLVQAAPVAVSLDPHRLLELIEGARELIRDIYGTHRDKENVDSDWEFTYEANKRVFTADVLCAWCDDAKRVLDGLDVELARLRGEATVRPADLVECYFCHQQKPIPTGTVCAECLTVPSLKSATVRVEE